MIKLMDANWHCDDEKATHTCQNKDGSDLGARTFKFSIDDSSLKLLGISSIESRDTVKAYYQGQHIYFDSNRQYRWYSTRLS